MLGSKLFDIPSYEKENSQLMVHIQQSVQYLSVTDPVHQAFNVEVYLLLWEQTGWSKPLSLC